MHAWSFSVSHEYTQSWFQFKRIIESSLKWSNIWEFMEKNKNKNKNSYEILFYSKKISTYLLALPTKAKILCLDSL